MSTYQHELLTIRAGHLRRGDFIRDLRTRTPMRVCGVVALHDNGLVRIYASDHDADQGLTVHTETKFELLLEERYSS